MPEADGTVTWGELLEETTARLRPTLGERAAARCRRRVLRRRGSRGEAGRIASQQGGGDRAHGGNPDRMV